MTGTHAFSARAERQAVATVVEKSRLARAVAADVHADVEATRARVRDTRAHVRDTTARARSTYARALDVTTALVDAQRHADAAMAERLDRLSGRVGRSRAIEEAKELLAVEYGISRGEAFELLSVLASRSNHKLRDVAEQLALVPVRSTA